MASNWESISAEKRNRLAETIPPDWKVDATVLLAGSNGSALEAVETSQVLSPAEREIINSTAVDLVARLAKGELKAVDVTLAFCKRAALAHQLVNLALEFFPEMALTQARDLDLYYEKTGSPIGPLHGLPISLKDQLRVKGLETSMGYVAWLGSQDTEESILTTLLRKAGAIFYIKTSVPQSLMACETYNNIIGRTINPRNANWSCGGSSGGEGANVSLRGGLIGVGTDIGGSIRVPAAFNFLYGIRPSHGRLPYAKMANSMEGQETMHSVCGPIAHSVDDLRLFIKSILQQEPWKYDPKVVPLPWNQQDEDATKAKIALKDLVIGFFRDDGVVRPHPPILRGVDKVVSVMTENGYKVIPWEPYRHADIVNLAGSIYASDGGKDIYSVLNASGEPAIPLISALIKPDGHESSATELWDIQLRKWMLQCEYLEQWRLKEAEIGKEMDVLIAPITPTAAIRHDQFKYYGYASAINFLDFTSVVVPVTFADKSLDVPVEGYKPRNEIDEAIQFEYDPEAYHGAPVAVQIVGRRLTEEKVLAIAEEIGRLLGNAIAP